eukprot:CAMPEP_0201133296 /NCGR_PEP_ID=MMETSP0850-20130426/48354_1 /ASSEMBLY_ACC=CAM_ASM_000622 /TAXON_ID=183588 /ORGANISM="Pseudo-nitzschia fraudulenta, Strain WWA7" /LENGTH=479 /DNA_ID=CAMNT_0047403885 /DNA_START=40 /DNA_END=1479 /DNA_ORIENTATION=-
MVAASIDRANIDSVSHLNSMNDNNVVVGLNGALQKRFVLAGDHVLVPGNVHRAASVSFGVGGKGQDAAIALHCLSEGGGPLDRDKNSDGDSDAVVNTTSSCNNIRLVQFIGRGSTGDTVYNLLKDRMGEKALEFTVRSSTEMRTCTSIVSSDDTTELVEPSGIIAKGELDALFSVLCTRNKENKPDDNGFARSLCIMGSMPPGCPEDTYARIYSETTGPNSVCVVDSLAGIRPLLQTIADLSKNGDSTGPLLFKINASELCKLAGTSKSNDENGGISVSELIDAIEGFLKKFSIATNDVDATSGVIGLAVTDGKYNAYFVSIRSNHCQEEQESLSPSFWVFKLPVPDLNDKISRTLYPIGAGDAVAAGTVGAWTSLSATNTAGSSSPFPPVIPEDSFASLDEFVEIILNHCSENTFGLSRVQVQAMAAFAFGLACGSASCLLEENSILDTMDVKRLFKVMVNSPPELIHKTTIRRPEVF